MSEVDGWSDEAREEKMGIFEQREGIELRKRSRV